MGAFLDSVRAAQKKKALDLTGICSTCGNLTNVGEAAIGCEAHDKLIIPEFPPHDNPNFKCKEWAPRPKQDHEPDLS